MIKYIAVEGERLDEIAWRYYENLNSIEEVIELNSHLPAILPLGAVVYLPPKKIKVKKVMPL